MLSGEIDLAVHSAKDMPMEFPPGLKIGAVLERADVRDVFVTANGIKAADLPAGSVVGTSSLRRELQIRAINPTVRIALLRGNVETRLRKLRLWWSTKTKLSCFAYFTHAMFWKL